ncbi:hypothetical protein EPI10_001191 [Gossypium australe]|uniref:Uncharacterized protein n=1 Tax=Gossypium australe TaxID=47621 RepID=A0A5B6VA52_9ROSI|nr:hypothetical protein EPI10_001191 [Gossypium australe]
MIEQSLGLCKKVELPHATESRLYVKGQRTSRSGLVLRGGSRKRNEVVAHQPEARASVRAYVVRTRDEGDATDVVAVWFYIVVRKSFQFKIEKGKS